MGAITKENKQGVLEIELNKHPKRHREGQTTTDFTDGQAGTCRRHYHLFPPRTLDQHYEKLIQNGKRFSEMSEKGFPSLQSIQPYFSTKSPSLPNTAVVGSVLGQTNDYNAAKRQRIINATEWGQKQISSLPDHFDQNPNPLAYFPKPRKLQQAISYSYVSQNNAPRFVELATDQKPQKNVYNNNPVIDTEEADSYLPADYYAYFNGYDVETLDSIMGY